ncbi:hypothetical protein CPER28S_03008 [Cellulomonas persica]
MQATKERDDEQPRRAARRAGRAARRAGRAARPGRRARAGVVRRPDDHGPGSAERDGRPADERRGRDALRAGLCGAGSGTVDVSRGLPVRPGRVPPASGLRGAGLRVRVLPGLPLPDRRPGAGTRRSRGVPACAASCSAAAVPGAAAPRCAAVPAALPAGSLRPAALPPAALPSAAVRAAAVRAAAPLAAAVPAAGLPGRRVPAGPPVGGRRCGLRPGDVRRPTGLDARAPRAGRTDRHAGERVPRRPGAGLRDRRPGSRAAARRARTRLGLPVHRERAHRGRPRDDRLDPVALAVLPGALRGAAARVDEQDRAGRPRARERAVRPARAGLPGAGHERGVLRGTGDRIGSRRRRPGGRDRSGGCRARGEPAVGRAAQCPDRRARDPLDPARARRAPGHGGRRAVRRARHAARGRLEGTSAPRPREPASGHSSCPRCSSLPSPPVR